MPKITKVFGMIIVVVLLLSIPIFIREEIEHYKKKKHMLENFSEIVGKNFKIDIEAENNNHPNTIHATQLTSNPSYYLIKTIGVGCPSCYSSIQKWKQFLEKSKARRNWVIAFFAYGEANDAFIHSIETESYPFIIILDQDSSLIKQNGLIDYGFQTFILDGDKNVIQVGDPLEFGGINRKINRSLK